MIHLEEAIPFDRAFIDAMIPHHQGAIRMARLELARVQTHSSRTWPRRSSKLSRGRSRR